MIYLILETEKHLESKSDLKSHHKKAVSIKRGFPPKPLDMSSRSGQELLCKDLGLKMNDSLIIEVNVAQLSAGGSSGPAESAIKSLKVPSDGSCLFNAISLGIEGNGDNGKKIRSLIATIILSDTNKYNRSFLGGGMEPQEYAEWICSDKKEWGGVPELRMLATHYETRLNVLDVGEG